MIYVRIEMWPGGDKTRARLLGEGTITNSGGSREAGQSDYVIELAKSPEYAKPGNVGKPWKRAVVTEFSRLRLGPWDLLLCGLLATCGYRNRAAVRAAGDSR